MFVHGRVYKFLPSGVVDAVNGAVAHLCINARNFAVHIIHRRGVSAAVEVYYISAPIFCGGVVSDLCTHSAEHLSAHGKAARRGKAYAL